MSHGDNIIGAVDLLNELNDAVTQKSRTTLTSCIDSSRG